jgi:PPOX class probable F420-dependent enzyme
MSTSLPENYLDLFNKKAFGVLTTLMPDGSPQTQPVWVDYQNGTIWVNSAEGRQKDKNVRRDPRVSVAIIDPDNPYRYLEVRGKVQEITNEGASNHIDKMAKKYLGQDKYPYAQPGEKRVLYKIKPEKFHAMG